MPLSTLERKLQRKFSERPFLPQYLSPFLSFYFLITAHKLRKVVFFFLSLFELLGAPEFVGKYSGAEQCVIESWKVFLRAQS